MRGSGKKSAHQKSGKSCSTKKETRSNIDISMQINDGSKISCAKKLRPKSKYHVRTGGSTSSNRTGTVPLIKRTGDGLVSKKPLTLPQDEKTSFLHCKGDKENASGDEKNENSKKRRERRKSKDKSGLDEAPRWQRRARYLLVKMKLEQNLIDAYSGEGWKGQSREKIRPEKELQRAKKQILKCKLGIRDAICQLELLSSVGCIEGSVIAPDGSVYHEHIICAKCELREAFPDNDIILCDGTCNRAFHQNCLDPPLATENIPPGDQGWLCNFCECKIDIIEAMNAHLGTYFSVNSSWQDIFKEEAALPDGGVALPNLEAEWPSDDSEDDDYDPENNEYRCSISRAGTEDGASDDANTSSSLSLSFEAEQFSGSGRLGNMREVSENNSVHLINSVDSDSTDGEILSGRRQRSSVDYKKLYDEMFGKDVPTNEQLSEDEDWGPAKRKRREKESDAASTLMTLCESEKKCPNVETMEIKKKFPPNPQRKRTLFRIPPGAVEKLRQVFSDNELPSRAVKENLSKELGIDSEKINKWFKNARYLALKTRKVEGSEVHSSIPRISKKSGSETVKNETCHPEGSKSTSSATLLHTPKNLKKFRRRNNPRSLTSPSKTTKLISAPLGSPTDSQKDNMEFSDDVSLKLLIAKSKMGKKRVNFETGGEVEAAEIEMERLCRIQGRLENMKQRFLGLQNENTDVWSVFYVPVAQLREKV